MLRAVRILIDVVHPAHVHFFRPVIARLRERGHRLLVTSREKDCTLELLDAFGIEHVPLTTAASSALGLAGEMFVRDARLAVAARQFRPHLVVGKEAACAHQVAWLLRIPSIALDDTDDARWQRRLSLPFASVVAADPGAGVRRGRPFVPVPGVSPLAYLHPNRFSPPPVRSESPEILVRLVRWKALHDVGERGIADDDLPTLIRQLSRLGRVGISSERPLDKKFSRYHWREPAERLHGVMAGCRLYVGESATMAAECAVLGVPAVYCSTRRLWYTDLLERRGLLRQVTTAEEALGAARELSRLPPGAWFARRDAYVAEVGDPVDRFVATIEAFPGCSKFGSD